MWFWGSAAGFGGALLVLLSGEGLGSLACFFWSRQLVAMSAPFAQAARTTSRCTGENPDGHPRSGTRSPWMGDEDRHRSGFPSNPAPVRGESDPPPDQVDRRFDDLETHRPDGHEALDLKPGLNAASHVARRKEGRTASHDFVDEDYSFEIGSEVVPPSKRSTEGGDIRSPAGRRSMRIRDRPGPFEKLLDIAPEALPVNSFGKTESRPERVVCPPGRAARNGQQGRVGSEDALEGCGLALPAQSRDTLKDIAAGILQPNP